MLPGLFDVVFNGGLIMRHFECEHEVNQFKKICPEWHVLPDPEGPGYLVVPHFLSWAHAQEMTALRRYFASVGHKVRVQNNPALRRWDILGVI